MMLEADPLRGPWIDVSRPLSAQTPVWAGDRALEITQERTPDFVLSSFSTTCHVGTHVDAPLHLDADGEPVDKIPLQRFLGRAEVVRTAPGRALISEESFAAGWAPRAPRVLFRTDSFSLDREIGAGFGALHSSLIQLLAAGGVELVGIDSPSVDPFESTEMPSHHALKSFGMTWIEGLWLQHAEPGLYDMIALPLALVGVDGAPIRVVLRRA